MIALFACDIVNQFIFLVGAIFVFRMQSVMRRVAAKDTAEAKSKAKVTRCQMTAFVVSFCIWNAVTLTLKTIVYNEEV